MEVTCMEQKAEKHAFNQPEQTEDTLGQNILQTEEKIEYLDRQIAENNKQIKHIEQSNTWKMSLVFRKAKAFLEKIFLSKTRLKDKQTIKQLKSKLSQTEDELLNAKQFIQHNQLKDDEITRNEIIQSMRTMKNEGELIDHLDTYVDQKVKHQKNFQTALTYAARLYMNEDEHDRNLIYSKIMPSLTIEEIPEFMIRAGLTDPSIPLHQASSFRGNLNMRMRQKQLNDTLPEWPLDDKRIAYNFAEQLGVNIPYVDDNLYQLETIPHKEGIVIKPADGAGSRGVYLVHKHDDIFDVKNSRVLYSWDQLIDRMTDDLHTGAVDKDSWMIEELIYENWLEKIPARDIKFYCFYGKVGIILEITRDPEVRQCWWTADGKRIATGKYDETLFKGVGVTLEELDMVKQLSAKVPAPFIRIDFLKGENGLVFGEFTPKPGNYDEFNEPTDQWLGDYFLDAQGRLINDLLNGKQFDEYMRLIKDAERLQA